MHCQSLLHTGCAKHASAHPAVDAAFSGGGIWVQLWLFGGNPLFSIMLIISLMWGHGTW